MKYAIHYNSSFQFFNEIDEVIFDWAGSEQIIEFIPSRLKEEQRAIINLKQIEDIETVIPYLNKLKTLHKNIAVQIGLSKKDFIPVLKENNIDFMFYDYCVSHEMFYTMKGLGVSDIYVVEELGFDLASLQDQGVILRVIPNIAQCYIDGKGIIPEITKFWIRPEDTEIYEQYIDVFEFYKLDDVRISTVYRIYKNRQWLGDLRDLILDLDVDINNKTISPHFGQMRTTCRKKCLYGKCNVCLNIADLATQFKAADIAIIKKKHKEDIPTEEKERVINELKERGKQLNEDELTVDKEVMHNTTE